MPLHTLAYMSPARVGDRNAHRKHFFLRGLGAALLKRIIHALHHTRAMRISRKTKTVVFVKGRERMHSWLFERITDYMDHVKQNNAAMPYITSGVATAKRLFSCPMHTSILSSVLNILKPLY